MAVLDRRLSTTVGGGLLVAATLVLVSPAVEQWIPVDAVVAALGNDYLLLAVVATLLVAGFVGVVLGRALLGVTEATPPPVETATTETPGRAVDLSLDSLPPIRTTEDHRRIHERLRQAVAGAVAGSTSGSPSEVDERIESGSWTDDATAASFVASETLDPPWTGRRLVAHLRGNHWFRERVEATVVALEALTEDRP